MREKGIRIKKRKERKKKVVIVVKGTTYTTLITEGTDLLLEILPSIKRK